MAGEIFSVAQRATPENEQLKEKLLLEKKIATAQLQMKNLVERISRLPRGVDESLFLKQLDKLQGTRTLNKERLSALKPSGHVDSVIGLKDFTKFSAHLRGLVHAADQKPQLQAKIIRKLVHKIYVTAKGIEIELYVGKHRIEAELGDQTPGSADFRQGKALKKLFDVGGSSTLTNGGDNPAFSTCCNCGT